MSLSINVSTSFFLGEQSKEVQSGSYVELMEKAVQLLVTIDKCTKEVNQGYVLDIFHFFSVIHAGAILIVIYVFYRQSLLVHSRDFSSLVYSVYPQLIYSFPTSTTTPFVLGTPFNSQAIPISPPPQASTHFVPIFPPSENKQRIPVAASRSSSGAHSPPPPAMITPKTEQDEHSDEPRSASPEQTFTLVGAEEEPPKKVQKIIELRKCANV